MADAPADGEARYAAYAELVDSYMGLYGAQSFIEDQGYYRQAGLCHIRLVDFDADGADELLLVHTEPGLRDFGDPSHPYVEEIWTSPSSCARDWDPYVTEVWGFREGEPFCALRTADARYSDGAGCSLGLLEHGGRTYLVTGVGSPGDSAYVYSFDGASFSLAASYESEPGYPRPPARVNGAEVDDAAAADPLVASYLGGRLRPGGRPLNYVPARMCGWLSSEYWRAYERVHGGGAPCEPEYLVLADGSAALLRDGWGLVGDRDGRVASVDFSSLGAPWSWDGVARTDSGGDDYVRFSATVDGRPCEVAWYGGADLFDCDGGYQVAPSQDPGCFEHPAGVELVPWVATYWPGG